jgi:hypothetical protein
MEIEIEQLVAYALRVRNRRYARRSNSLQGSDNKAVGMTKGHEAEENQRLDV